MKGLFITFEGVEGCGKTTQIQQVKHYLESRDFKTLLTREPGGTPIGECIRQILLNPENTAMDGMCELLLYAAARAQHIQERIQPALNEGKAILSDRFIDSTTAYQGAGRNIPETTLEALNQFATKGLMPDRTYLLDLPPEIGLERARERGRADRLEQESITFHQQVREGFLKIARAEPNRIKVIDANRSIETVFNDIRQDLDVVLNKALETEAQVLVSPAEGKQP